MSRLTVLITIVVTTMTALGVVGIVWMSQPEPLTGDRASDAACAATADGVLDDGDPSKVKFLSMSVDERREYLNKVAALAEDAGIPEIRDAGERMALAGATAGDSMFGILPSVGAMSEMAKACNSHGWTAKAAGLLDSE